MATRDLDRWLVNHEERAEPTRPEPSTPIDRKLQEAAEIIGRYPSELVEEVRAADTFNLTVRQTNNLVRFLMMNGWISHEQHPDVHDILHEMTRWLERQGIEVSLHMPEMR